MTRMEIEAFLAIIKYGSITAAAGKLYVTQPALSRRIRAVEEELGYELIVRNKGVRTVCLTEEGKAFVAVAEKFCYLYQEASAICNRNQKPVLNVSSVGSVSTYLLPEVLHSFLGSKVYNLCFHNYHSFEAYSYVESGMIDIALISDDMYSKKVMTVPAFQEPFVLLGGEGWKGADSVHPTQLDPQNEIRLPWNPEYDAWHEKWFDETVYPNVNLDQMSLLEEFLVKENWAIVPLTVARRLKHKNLPVCTIKEGPDDRIIYYLISSNRKQELVGHFLSLLHRELTSITGVKSLLSDNSEQTFSLMPQEMESDGSANRL